MPTVPLPPIRAASFCCGAPGAVVVGGNEAYVAIEIYSRVKDGDRDSGSERSLQRSDQRAFVGRGDRQSIHPLGDHGVHNLDLTRIVGFIRRPIPEHVHVQIMRRLFDAGVHGNEEQMGGGFGNHTNDLLMRAVAGGETQAENQMAARDH